MGYLARKSGKTGFKILYRIQGKSGFSRGVPSTEWATLGFRRDMTLEEAKARASQLNSMNKLTKLETKRNAIQQRMSEERLTQQVFLPDALALEFEQRKLKLEKPKTRYYWTCARRIIAEVALEPKEWADHKEAFYRAFIKRAMSGTYIRAVLPLINEWGVFVARHHGTFFLPVPYPRGGWLKDVKEAHRRKRMDPNAKRPGNRKSRPLTPDMLESKREKLLPEHYRWLRCAVWFGLRGIEADSLGKPSAPDTWWTDETEDGIKVLVVWQSKLYGQDDEDRIKYIPCFTREQLEVLAEVVKGLPVARPSRKTIINLFGEQITTHGGRKNFTKLMKKHGQDFQDVSRWLGHSDIQRTFQDYFEKVQVNVKRPA